MSQEESKRFSLIRLAESMLAGVAAWAALIFFHGYVVGVDDQVELLPYILLEAGKAFYPGDFYLEGMSALGINERWVLVKVLARAVNNLEPVLLFLHILSTVLLFTGLERIGLLIFPSKWPVRLTILLCLTFFYNKALGGVELYYNTFQASNLAKGILAWALLAFLKKKWPLAFGLAAAATFIQIIAGLTLAMTFGGTILILAFLKQISFRKALTAILIYLIPALPFLILILLSRTHNPEALSDAAFFEIVFRFRHPHHFLMAEFHPVVVVFNLMLTGFLLVWAFKKSKELFIFSCVYLLALAGYVLVTDGIENPMLAGFQWYKMSIWIKVLGLFAMLGLFAFWIEKFAPRIAPFREIIAIFSLIFLLGYSTWKQTGVNREFHFGDYISQNDLLRLCREADQTLPAASLFIQPFEVTAVKYYARRGSWVEFKANVRDRGFAGEWMRRLTIVYGLAGQSRETGFALQQRANDYFYQMDENSLIYLEEQGVTHILTDLRHNRINRQAVLQAGNWAILSLKSRP